MDANEVAVKERVPASRKLGRDDAQAIAEAASKVIVAKGKNVDVAKPGGKPDDELVSKMLGPTGNLRAPTVKVGKTVLVGFNEDEYRAALL